MSTLITKSEQRCFGGVQGFYEQDGMRFGVYLPRPGVPAVYVLAGLECNEQTFAMKAGAQRVAAELGLALVTPDTSPRVRYPGDDASWDFGQAASFYLDATVAPWSDTYRMHSWISGGLVAAVEASFDVAQDRRGIMGHSMGGHGALTIGLTYPQRYNSVSALAPICAPSRVPWGQKAFSGYLGDDRAAWARYDATALIENGARAASEIRIDQGSADKFLTTQLLPEVFLAACGAARQPLKLEMHPGYDHGYYFISSVIEAQLRHHAERLARHS